MISYKDSMKFHMALSRMNEEDRTSVLNYTIALAEEGIRFEVAVKKIQEAFKGPGIPVSEIPREAQTLLLTIWEAVGETKN